MFGTSPWGPMACIPPGRNRSRRGDRNVVLVAPGENVRFCAGVVGDVGAGGLKERNGSVFVDEPAGVLFCDRSDRVPGVLVRVMVLGIFVREMCKPDAG